MQLPLVIGGGVGPMAGVALHARIIQHTRTDGTDQSHLEVLHFSCSNRVLDRTEYLLGKVKENPAWGMVQIFEAAWEAVKVLGYEGIGAIGGIPCNTFHAPSIFSLFQGEIYKRGIRIRVLHLLEETVRFIAENYPEQKNIGVLSTSGTRKTALYRQLLESNGYRIVEVPEEEQDAIQQAIYHPEWGIKAKSPVTPKAREEVVRAIHRVKERGAEAVILGCTELPLAVPETILEDVPILDPMVALARAMIREAAADKLLQPLPSL
ncbi:MAG: amino acid racemase [Spirochaetales bacterium]